jgi:hypothetical protein
MMWHDGWGAGNWVLMSVMMLIIAAAVIGGAIWLARAVRGQPDSRRS